jgi:hypothetical protein
VSLTTICHVTLPWLISFSLDGSNEQRCIQLSRCGARSIVPRTEWIPSLVCTVDRLCAGLWRIALVENDFVVSVACRHGYSLSA